MLYERENFKENWANICQLWLKKPPDVAGWGECNICLILVLVAGGGVSVGLEMATVSPCPLFPPALCARGLQGQD